MPKVIRRPKALTKSLIARQLPRSKPYDVWDTRLRGLILRVLPSGNKAYFLQVRRGVRIRLGHVSIDIDTIRAVASKMVAAIAKGEDPTRALAKSKDLTFLRFVDDEWAPWAEEHLRTAAKALQRLRSNFRHFHHLLLSEITPAQFDKLRTARLASGKKRRTANRDLDDIRGVLSKAVEWGFLETNPLAGVRKLTTDRLGVVRYLKKDEERRLFEQLDVREVRIKDGRRRANAGRALRGYPLLPTLHNHVFADHLKPMILISLHTGLRQGELFDLTWSNVDLDQRGMTIVGETAKSHQTRHIPLNAVALQTFLDWRDQCLDDSGLVFPSPKGGRFDNVKTAWKALLRKAAVIKFRWHDMRHTFASRLVMQGVDLNAVRELLGHADYQMTLRYTHLAPEHKANAVARLVDVA